MIRFNSRIRIYIVAVVLGLITVSTPQFRDFISKWTGHWPEGHPRRYARFPGERIIGKYGFLNKNGVQVVAPTLDQATNFSQGLAAVKLAEHWNIMDKSGKMLLKPRFGAILQVQPCEFADGLTPMQLDYKWGFVNQRGAWVVKPEFDEVEPFDHGLAKVRNFEKGCGFVNTEGIKVLPLKFTQVSAFYKGLAAAETEDGVGLIDTHGNWKVKPKYKADFETEMETGGVFRDGVFVLARADEYATSGNPVTYDCFDTDARLLFTFTCTEMNQFIDGNAAFEKDGRWGLVNKRGIITVKPAFDEVYSFANGVAAARKNFDDDSWHYFDSAGKPITVLGSKPIGPIGKPYFSDGLAAMRIDKHWGFVNASGDVVVPPRYEEVGDFHDGMVWVMPEGKFVRPVRLP